MVFWVKKAGIVRKMAGNIRWKERKGFLGVGKGNNWGKREDFLWKIF